VKIDRELHEEVLERFKKLNLAPFSGFVNPRYTPFYEKDDLVDITIDYTQDYTEQMIEYSDKYSVLPDLN